MLVFVDTAGVLGWARRGSDPASRDLLLRARQPLVVALRSWSGRPNDELRSRGVLPAAFAAVDATLAPGGAAEKLPLGAAELSVLRPGAHLVRHCGPTNHRIRLHLGLVVPTGAVIEVGGERRTWAEGVVLVIDDSFEHEVWNNGTTPRVR